MFRSAPGITSWRRFLAPAALLICILFSLLIAVLRPIPHGHEFGMALKLSSILAGIWFVYRVKPGLIFTKGMRIFVLIVGLAVCVGGFIALRPSAEIVRHYLTVFQAVQDGRNPYTCGTVLSLAEFGEPALGNFRYPPMELYPYYLLYLVSGTWNIWVLTIFKLAIHAAAGVIFLWTFPEIKRKYLLPFLPLFLFLEIQQNPSMALLMTALVLFAINRNRDKPWGGSRYVIAVLFGIGLMTKFLIIPLMAAYYWHKFDPKRLRSLLDIGVEAGVALATAVLMIAPYGVVAVFKNTILFNLILKDRNAFATFFPNVLSGFFTWIHLQGLYPVAAVAILGLSILAAPRLKVHSAMLAATFTFLLVAPTPRTQFVPLVIYLALAGIIVNLKKEGAIPPAAVRATGLKRAPQEKPTAGDQSALRRQTIR